MFPLTDVYTAYIGITKLILGTRNGDENTPLRIGGAPAETSDPFASSEGHMILSTSPATGGIRETSPAPQTSPFQASLNISEIDLSSPLHYGTPR